MTNIASVLKAEISRIARKEVRVQISILKKALSASRSEVTALKRRTQALEQQLRPSRRSTPKVAPASVSVTAADKLRFSAKGLASQRQRLGLSAADCGLLVGTSGQSIYNWEAGKTRPRAAYLPAISALRSMGKKQATARLEPLKAPS